jgi:hypothetical protein
MRRGFEARSAGTHPGDGRHHHPHAPGGRP